MLSKDDVGYSVTRCVAPRFAGIYSGCIYLDATMKGNGFPGEYRTTDVVFVKAHVAEHPKVVNGKVAHYDKIIHLVRNPFHAMVAERKRLVAYSMTFWNIHQFTPPLFDFLNGRECVGCPHPYAQTSRVPWQEWVKTIGFPRWLETVRVVKNEWLNNPAVNVSVLTVRYEDLKQDVHTKVAGMLNFLGAFV